MPGRMTGGRGTLGAPLNYDAQPQNRRYRAKRGG